jgi:four helix bundle protein
MGTFRDLQAWQKSMDLAALVLHLAEDLRAARLYAFSDQLQRSAISIPSNIAEGQGRVSPGDFSRFIRYANGSLRELETQLELLLRSRPDVAERAYRLMLRAEEIGRMMNGLLGHLAKRRIGEGQLPASNF